MKKYYPRLSHAQLAAFMRHGNDAPTRERMEELQREEPAYRALFEVIAACRAQTEWEPHAETRALPQTTTALDDLLLRVYAEDASSEEAEQLLTGLMTSPFFYQRILAKLEALAPHAVWAEAFEPENDVVKSGDAVWQIVTQAAPSPAFVRQRIPSRLRLWVDNFMEDARRLAAPIVREASRGQEAIAILVAGIMQALAYALDVLTRHRALAFATPLALFATIFYFNEQQQREFWGQFAYADNVPHEYHSITRGGSPTAQPDAMVEAFQQEYDLAMSDYVLRRYAATLQGLEKLGPTLPALQSRLREKDYAARLNEYNFYRGVTHLALAQNLQSPEQENKTAHLHQAATFLARADSSARRYELQDNDREAYFLGLALGFAHNPSAAISALQRVSEQSMYHAQSRRLISKWAP